MIVTTRDSLTGTPRDASGPGWRSLRLLAAADGTDFTMTDTTLLPGHVLKLHYTHHIEAVYCLSGEAELTDIATGDTHRIVPGTLYCLNDHDAHEVRVTSSDPMRVICVFTPALRGDEVHRPDGSYAPA